MYNPEENNYDLYDDQSRLENELFDELNELIRKYFHRGASARLVLKIMKNISDDIEVYLVKEKDF